jgi:hypothetical protein
MPQFPAVAALQHFEDCEPHMTRCNALLKQVGHTVPEIWPLFKLDPVNQQVIIHRHAHVRVSPYFTKIRVSKAAFKPTLDVFKSDTSHPMKRRKWDKPTDTLAQVQNISIPKFLQDIMKVDRTADALRDLATHLLNYTHDKNTDPNLYFCSTPKDYVDLHRIQNGSCMQVGSNHTMGARAALLKSHDVWPSIWYHYCPQVQGVAYKSASGEWLARGFLLRDGDKGPWTSICRGRSEYNDKDSSDKLDAAMLKITNNSNRGVITINVRFTIPVEYEYGGKAACPIPYHDSIMDGYYIAYSHKENIFEIIPAKEFKERDGWKSYHMRGHYETKGWVLFDKK